MTTATNQHRDEAARRHLRHWAGRLLAPVPRLEGAARRLSAHRGAARRAVGRGGVRGAGGFGAGRRGGRQPVPAPPSRHGLLLRGHLRHQFPGAARGADSAGAGAGAQSAAECRPGLRLHRHQGVAGQLLRLLRAGDQLRVQPVATSTSTWCRACCRRSTVASSRRGARGRRFGSGRGRRRAAHPARQPHRRAGPRVPRHARPVQRLYPAPGATRHPRRDSRKCAIWRRWCAG